MTGDVFGRELQRLRDVQVAEAVAAERVRVAKAIADAIEADCPSPVWHGQCAHKVFAAVALLIGGGLSQDDALAVVNAAVKDPDARVLDSLARTDDPAFEREASNEPPVAAVEGGKPLDAYPSDQTAFPDAPGTAERVSTEGDAR